MVDVMQREEETASTSPRRLSGGERFALPSAGWGGRMRRQSSSAALSTSLKIEVCW